MIKRKTMQDKAELAMKKAIEKVLARHKKSGRSLAIWEKGRVKRVFAQ